MLISLMRVKRRVQGKFDKTQNYLEDFTGDGERDFDTDLETERSKDLLQKHEVSYVEGI